MEPIDAALLEILQCQVPLVAAPFAHIATQLKIGQDDVIHRIKELSGTDGIIREIAGVFDSAALGYDQALVAMAIDPANLDSASHTIASHPGVSHCYQRGHVLNLWFTMATSPDSTLGLQATINLLAGLCNARQCLLLPTLKRYKLSLQFNLQNGVDGSLQRHQPGEHTPPQKPTSITPEQKKAIAALQISLPLVHSPFEMLASEAGLETEQLLAMAEDFMGNGWMRRYAAVLRHRVAGAKANVLAVWNVPQQEADQAGLLSSKVNSISHCYLRPTSQEWNYNLYTMIHGKDQHDCQATVDHFARLIGVSDYQLLWTEREIKKQRVRLFSNHEQEWESLHQKK